MKHRIRAAVLFVLLLIAFLFPVEARSAQCYIKRGSFGVAEPNLVERVCFLHRHEARMYRPGETAPQTLNMADLHPDPLHADFIQLILDKKYMVLKAGTPVFSCQYDIEALRRDPNSSAVMNVRPPEFNCDGFIYRFVPVRIVNTNNCMWVAIEAVTCDDLPPSPSAFQQDPTNLRNE